MLPNFQRCVVDVRPVRRLTACRSGVRVRSAERRRESPANRVKRTTGVEPATFGLGTSLGRHAASAPFHEKRRLSSRFRLGGCIVRNAAAGGGQMSAVRSVGRIGGYERCSICCVAEASRRPSEDQIDALPATSPPLDTGETASTSNHSESALARWTDITNSRLGAMYGKSSSCANVAAGYIAESAASSILAASTYRSSSGGRTRSRDHVSHLASVAWPHSDGSGATG